VRGNVTTGTGAGTRRSAAPSAAATRAPSPPKGAGASAAQRRALSAESSAASPAAWDFSEAVQQQQQQQQQQAAGRAKSPPGQRKVSFVQAATAPLSAREQQLCEQRGMGLVRGALGSALAASASAAPAGGGLLSGLELVRQAVGSQLQAVQGQQQQQPQAPAAPALELFDGPVHFVNDGSPAGAQQQQRQWHEAAAEEKPPYHIPAPSLAAAAWGVPLEHPWHLPPPLSPSPTPPPACHSPMASCSISVATQTHAQLQRLRQQGQQQQLQAEPSALSAANTEQQEGVRELLGALRTWRMHARIHKHRMWGRACARPACLHACVPACLPCPACLSGRLPGPGAEVLRPLRPNAACREEQAQSAGQACRAAEVQRLRGLQRAFGHWHGVQERRRALLSRALGHWGSHSKELCFGGWRVAARTSSQQRQLSSSHYGRASQRRVLLAWANASVACKTKVGWRAGAGAGAGAGAARLPGAARRACRAPASAWRGRGLQCRTR
jgi:hypothetical protein